jgi:hypothetical protein
VFIPSKSTLAAIKRLNSGKGIQMTFEDFLIEQMKLYPEHAELLQWKLDVMHGKVDALTAVRTDGHALMLLPKKMITPEVYFAAVRNEGWMLQFVPEELKTPELCLAAMQNCGEALQFVPKALRTPEICRAAVQDYGDAIQFVPDELLGALQMNNP